MPSPEHGASTSTLSKYPPSFSASISGYTLETTVLRTPMRSKLEDKIAARLRTTSFDHKSPVSPVSAAICVDLPPGAAQRSSTLSPGSGAKSVTAEDADGSCE